MQQSHAMIKYETETKNTRKEADRNRKPEKQGRNAYLLSKAKFSNDQ